MTIQGESCIDIVPCLKILYHSGLSTARYDDLYYIFMVCIRWLATGLCTRCAVQIYLQKYQIHVVCSHSMDILVKSPDSQGHSRGFTLTPSDDGEVSGCKSSICGVNLTTEVFEIPVATFCPG